MVLCVQVVADIVARGASPANIRVVSIVAAPPALRVLSESFPGLRVYTAIIDEQASTAQPNHQAQHCGVRWLRCAALCCSVLCPKQWCTARKLALKPLLTLRALGSIRGWQGRRSLSQRQRVRVLLHACVQVDAKGYIHPGLGDAGDRAFGTMH